MRVPPRSILFPYTTLFRSQHLMSMFIQYAPYKLRDARWDDLRESFAERCFDLLNEYAPNFKKSVHTRSTDRRDRKSTRLNSSHANISYAVFCLKKKKNKNI